MISVFILIFLILIILLSWILLIRDCKFYNVPGPAPIPILGNGHLFLIPATKFLPRLYELHKNFGDAVRAHLLHHPYILLYHPKYAEPLLTRTDLLTKAKSYNFLHDWLGAGLITSTGNRWRTHRKFLTPAFHFNILQNFIPILLKNEKILISKLKSSHSDGKAFDVFPIIALTALDNVTESIMGISFNAQTNSNSKYVKSIKVMSEIIALRMRNPIMGTDTIFKITPYKKAQDEALKILHGHTKKVIDLRKKELEDSNNVHKLGGNSELGIKNKHAFLDLLLLSQADGHKIDDVHVREEVDTFMFAGHDTTTSAISFALYCISKHEEVQDKIIAEQKTILGDDLSRDPTYSDLKQMKYLEQVIKETLRLFPSVPLVGRYITKDIDLAGLRIKKNTTAVMDIIHMQRNPEIYERPLEFWPERFSSEAANSGNNAFTWLTFSAGPRNCIGQKYALMAMKVILAGVVKNFKLFSGEKEVALCFDLILRSENGIDIKLLPRSLNEQ